MCPGTGGSLHLVAGEAVRAQSHESNEQLLVTALGSLVQCCVAVLAGLLQTVART